MTAVAWPSATASRAVSISSLARWSVSPEELSGDIVGGLVVPLFEVGVLVLEGVGQLVGQDGLLLFDVDPVEHVDGLGFGVVVGFDLLLEQREQKGLEGEVAIEQAEFLENDFASLEALGALVLVEFLVQVAFDGGAGGDAGA